MTSIVNFVSRWTPIYLIVLFVLLNAYSAFTEPSMVPTFVYTSWILLAVALLHRVDSYLAKAAS